MKHQNRFQLPSSRRHVAKGYSLIEVMLALVILAAGVAGVYMMLKPAGINAGVQQEQKQLTNLVNGVQSAFGTTGGSYENISVASARELELTGVGFNNNSLQSALGDNITLRSATVRQNHDAFDAVYTGLDTKKCLAYVKAFSPQTHTILVGASQTQVQSTSGVNEGRLVAENQIVQACNQSAFQNNQGQVAFRFFSPSAQSSSVVENVCSCSPRIQTRQLGCATGQSGDITQERNSTCSGGTGACPTEVWSAWNTTSNTCSGGLTPVGPPPTDPGNDLCVPTTEQRTQLCPVGYNGSIVEERNSTCANPSSDPVWGAWAEVSRSCAPNHGETYTCTPAVENRNIPCPAPLSGSITQVRSSTCATPNATPVWGSWIEQSQNCQQACVTGQNCCQPQPDQFRDELCPAGQYGLINEVRSSYCPSASSSLQWNGWLYNTGSCTACTDANETRQVWQARSQACPAGQTGSHTWEEQRNQSRTGTRSCPAGTLTLPAPVWGSWVNGSWTGNRRNEVNTCAVTSCTIPAGTTRTWTVGGNTCNGPALTSAVTIASGTSRAWNDVIAPTTGTASFQCTNTVLSVTPNPGATCTSGNCATGRIVSGSGWIMHENVIDNGVQYDRNSWWATPSNIIACHPGGGGTWALSDVPKPWEPRCACTAATNGASYDYSWGEWGGLENLGTATCIYTPYTILDFSVSNMELVGSGATATLTVTPRVGSNANVPQTVTLSCASFTTVGSYQSCALRDFVIDGFTHTLKFGRRSGALGIFDYNNQLIPPTSGSYGACVPAACTAPAPTNTAVTRPATPLTRTLTCHEVHGGTSANWTGSISQSRTRTENGTQTTTWTCPGPTSSVTTAWHGTYNLGSWTTTSDTCAPVAPVETFSWARVGHVYGTGFGCHLASDRTRAQYLVNNNILVGHNWNGTHFTDFSVHSSQICNATHAGDDIVVYESCGDWQSDLEGYSGYECRGSLGTGADYEYW